MDCCYKDAYVELREAVRVHKDWLLSHGVGASFRFEEQDMRLHNEAEKIDMRTKGRNN